MNIEEARDENGDIIQSFTDVFGNYDVTLPNLDFQFRVGNSLQEKIDDIELKCTMAHKNFSQHLKSKTKMFVANSQFCASMYKRFGIKVDEVIYPPIDSKRFKPKTSRPANDYVLTYIGKETKYSILNTMANFNIKIKAFGAKNRDLPKKIRKNPNIEILGNVTAVDLVKLYSNALYTLFTFTHEPFGYIPVESMACATPVLTHNKQGPKESIINNKTGWLMDNDEEMTEKAIRIWKEGYSTKLRKNCLTRASEFDQRLIGEKWLRLLELLS
ncbi:MAG: glycosyltransferase [Desulfobacterales bacterium]